jgi:hypothetical protein
VRVWVRSRLGETSRSVLGGLLFQLLLRAHLSDDALTLVRQRIIVMALLA